MKFGVITFPGSNCDDDMVYVLEQLLNQETVRLWHKDTDLQGVDMVILPGGFSYGDYLRSGAIAGLSPIMNEVKAFANGGGKVLGICNGFQILCESGLLPGVLLHNHTRKFICRNTTIKAATANSDLTRLLPSGKVLRIPIAHAEGNYYIDQQGLESLKQHDQVIFQYCNEKGEVTTESNPNGALFNIAGICNQQRNVFGMMPHPERAADGELANMDGKFIFESIFQLMNE